MSIRSGSFLFVGNSFIFDRSQVEGVTNFNIPTETIREVGSPLTVGIVRDIPDLSFDVETYDMTPTLEALINGQDPTNLTAHQMFDPLYSIPMHVVSPIRAQLNSTSATRGVAVPYLTLENLTYKFAVRANATKTATFRGDSAYFTPGPARYQRFTISGTGPYTLNGTAAAYVDPRWGPEHVLDVTLKNPTTGVYKRLFYGFDFTDTATAFTLLATPDPSFTVIDVVYGATVGSTDTYPLQHSVQGSFAPPALPRPAAVRAKNIDVYVSNNSATPTFTRLSGVQTVDITRRVTLDNDEEFGNPHFVSQDYTVPAVTGTLAFKPVDATDLINKISYVTGVDPTTVIGPFSSVPVAMEVRVSDPVTGSVLETVYVPDARFLIPAINARVGQKQVISMTFSGDSGVCQAFYGTRF